MLDVNVNISVKETYEVICDLAPKVKRGLANTFAVLKGVITEQQAKIFGRVTRRVQELLDTAGVQPDEIRPCPLMLGALWTERASLEENSTLQELWARLMANALNPNFQEEVRAAFPDIITALSPLEAVVLNDSYESLRNAGIWDTPQCTEAKLTFDKEKLMQDFKVDELNLNASLLNLERCQLVTTLHPVGAVVINGSSSVHKGEPSLTALGVLFIRACIQ